MFTTLLGVKVMITELDVDVLPLTKEAQIIGSVMSSKQFQLEESKSFLDPYQAGLPKGIQVQLANRYAELFGTSWKHRDQIDRVTLWGGTMICHGRAAIRFLIEQVTHYFMIETVKLKQRLKLFCLFLRGLNNLSAE